jgi:hypothetical protein
VDRVYLVSLFGISELIPKIPNQIGWQIGCVSAGSFESISFQPMLALHMIDRRFNGCTPFHQAPQPFWNRSAA